MSPLVVALIALGLVALIVVAAVIAGPDTKRQAAVRNAPGAGLAPPGATLLDRFESRPYRGGTASYGSWYGTDLGADEIAAFYDDQLEPLSWERVRGPEPPGLHGEVLLREYRRDGLRLLVELSRLPRKIGNRWVREGYPTILSATVRDK